MPRKPRFFIPGVAVHVVQRGHSRNPVCFDTSDYQAYLSYLYDALDRYSELKVTEGLFFDQSLICP